MSGDHEDTRAYRYACECTMCDAALSVLTISGARRPGQFIRCKTPDCGWVNYATEPAEFRPPRGTPEVPDDPFATALSRTETELETGTLGTPVAQTDGGAVE